MWIFPKENMGVRLNPGYTSKGSEKSFWLIRKVTLMHSGRQISLQTAGLALEEHCGIDRRHPTHPPASLWTLSHRQCLYHKRENRK